MNYSIRMLQRAVCLCFGLISIEAWAANTEYNDELIEKAWSCNARSSDMTGLGPTAVPRFLIDFYGADLRLCGDGGDLMRKALLNKYFVFRWVPVRYEYGPQVIGPEEQGTYEEFIKKSERQGNRGVELTGVDSSLFDEERIRREQIARDQQAREEVIKQEQEEKQKLEQQELQRVKQEAGKEYQWQLKSGAVPVKNFQDAVLLYAPTASLTDLMVSPLLKPDRSIYSGMVRLDAEDGDNLLRAKIDTSLLFGGRFGGGIYYAHLRLTKKTVNFSPRSMRIGGAVNVMGRYVQNRRYTTIAGEEKTMPVFDVMYIGD